MSITLRIINASYGFQQGPQFLQASRINIVLATFTRNAKNTIDLWYWRDVKYSHLEMRRNASK